MFIISTLYDFFVIRQFRPSFKDLSCWPSINLDSEPGSSPFLLKPACPESAKTKTKPEVKTIKDPTASKFGSTLVDVSKEKPVLRRSPRKRNSPQKKHSPPKRNIPTSHPSKKCSNLVFQDKERYSVCRFNEFLMGIF